MDCWLFNTKSVLQLMMHFSAIKIVKLVFVLLLVGLGQQKIALLSTLDPVYDFEILLAVRIQTLETSV